RCQQDFTCSPTFGFSHPLFGLYLRLISATSKVYIVLSLKEARVYGYHDKLGSKGPREIINKLRITDSRGVYRYFVRTTIQQDLCIRQFVNPSPYCKRNINLSGHSLYKFYRRLPLFMRGGNVKEYQLISPLLRVLPSQLDWVSGIP